PMNSASSDASFPGRKTPDAVRLFGMNGIPDRTGGQEDRASLEAARWLVALEDEPADAALQARIDAWRAASPENERAWTDTAAVYGLMAATTPRHRDQWGDQGNRREAVRVVPLAARRSRGRLVMAGMAMALAACVLFVVGPGLLIRLQADHVTATAEVRSFG